MATEVSLGTIPKWIFFDPQGGYNPDTASYFTTPAVNGYFYAFRSSNKQESKAIYQDAGGILAYLQPARLDAVGGIGPIYWETDEAYYIVVRKVNTDGTPGEIIFSMDNYVPEGEGGSSVVTQLDIKNYIRNGQFTYNFGNTTDTYDSTTNVINIAEGEWVFSKDADNVSDEIQFVKFPLGQTDVDINPIYYLRYDANSAVGTDETIKRISWFSNNVETLSTKELMVSWYGRSSGSAQIDINVRQHFGTGGSPSSDVITPVSSTIITPAWDRYSAKVTIPTISGKTLGTNGDDALFLDFNIPRNTVVNFDLCGIQMELGDKLNDYEYTTNEDILARVRGSLIPSFSEEDIGKGLTVINPRDQFPGFGSPYLAWSGATVPTGAIIMWMGLQATIPDGWLALDGSIVVRNEYQNLFAHFGTGSSPAGFPIDQIWDSGSYSGTGNQFNLLCLANGTVVDPQDFGTTVSLTVIQQGSSTQPEKTTVVFPPAASIPAGSYFYINTPSREYYVWYEKDGIGSDPGIVSKTGLKILISSTDTDEAVAQKTWLQGMFLSMFILPNTKDLFIRGVGDDTNRLSYRDYLGDTNIGVGNTGANPATYQLADNAPHIHGATTTINVYGTAPIEDDNIYYSNVPDATRVLGSVIKFNPGTDQSYKLYTTQNVNTTLSPEAATTTIASSGSEGRPKNVTAYFIIKT